MSCLSAFPETCEVSSVHLIVGLGNPTAKYENTRHNAGFHVIDAIAEKYNITVNMRKGRAFVGSGVIGGEKVLLAKPQTYMNLSGESVRSLVDFYKLDPEEELTVIFDDISLAPGNLRIRRKGSAGGHNGVKSIIACLGTDGFSRIKMGVGAKPADWDLADYVLSRFSAGEKELFEEAVPGAVDAAALIVQGRIDEAMNLYNRKKTENEQ